MKGPHESQTLLKGKAQYTHTPQRTTSSHMTYGFKNCLYIHVCTCQCCISVCYITCALMSILGCSIKSLRTLQWPRAAATISGVLSLAFLQFTSAPASSNSLAHSNDLLCVMEGIHVHVHYTCTCTMSCTCTSYSLFSHLQLQSNSQSAHTCTCSLVPRPHPASQRCMLKAVCGQGTRLYTCTCTCTCTL